MASVSSKSEFQFFQKFVNKEKCLEFFKSKEIRKTTQLSGWQKLVKCKKCEHYDELHHMNSVTRLIFIINQQQQQLLLQPQQQFYPIFTIFFKYFAC